MTKKPHEAKYVVWTRGGSLAVIFGPLVIIAGQALRLQLGEEWWIAGNIVSAVTIIWVTGLLGLTAFGAWSRATSKLKVFEDKIMLTTNTVWEITKQIRSEQIESVSGEQSILGRSSYGNVTITATGGASITAEAVSNWETLVEVITETQKSNSNSGNNARPQQAEGENFGLDQIVKMRLNGHLTEEEFVAAKKKFLEGHF